jgi:hypothetical protein
VRLWFWQVVQQVRWQFDMLNIWASLQMDGAPALVSAIEWGISLIDKPAGADNNWFKLAEVEMFLVQAGGTDQCTGGTGSAQFSFAGNPAANLFDNSAATFWLSGNVTEPLWIKYTHAATKEIRRIDITGPADLANGSPPTTFALGYWLVGVFTPLLTVPATVTWTAGEKKSYIIQ